MELKFFVTLKDSQSGFAVREKMFAILVVELGNYYSFFFLLVKNGIKKKATLTKGVFLFLYGL